MKRLDATLSRLHHSDWSEWLRLAQYYHLAARKSIDSFTLSEGNQKVRGLLYAADPQNRVVTILARTTTKLPDRFEFGSPTFMQYDLRERKVIRTVRPQR